MYRQIEPSGGHHENSHPVVIPLLPGAAKITEGVLVHGGSGYPASRLQVTARFPVELSFAITVNKAQGRTIDNVILALSEKPTRISNMGLKELYVALSRVRKGSHIRLLLAGNNGFDMYNSILYVERLKRDAAVDAFFAGFHTADDWKTNNWSCDTAYDYYKTNSR